PRVLGAANWRAICFAHALSATFSACLPPPFPSMSPISTPSSAIQNDPLTSLVAFSGGQDSTACLAWSLSRYANVETVGFDYGQRHRVELDCRGRVRQEIAAASPDWAPRLGEDHMLDLGLLGQISDTALTASRAIAMQA